MMLRLRAGDRHDGTAGAFERRRQNVVVDETAVAAGAADQEVEFQ